ncbi:hypothetical protein GZH53_08910 [Flavihumibacter sp. R14]|nr:hypothetical protein [Flavihumibacter soli]
MKSTKGANNNKLLVKISRSVFLVLAGIFILLLITNRSLYQALVREDGVAEWLTFVLLIATGFVSLAIGYSIKKRYGYWHWFFWLFFAFNLLAGLEEISWGQRLFNMKTEGVFAKYSDQNEINLHNTLQGLAMVKTKHIAMYALFLYGVLLPWLIRKGKLNGNWLFRNQLIVPPTFLGSGFLIATLFMIDVPTGNEEEVGEFLYSICFLLMMLHNLYLVKHSPVFDQAGEESRSNKIPSFSE